MTGRMPSKKRPIAIIGGVVGLLLLVGVLRPSPYSKVTNLDSKGSAVIAFGDSLTAGYGAGPGEDYPSRVTGLSGISIQNAGVSGDTTAAALARLQSDVLDGDPRIVMVGLGGNDFLRGVSIDTTEANLRTIIKQVQGEGAMVILLGFSFPSLQVNYREMYEKVAEEEGCFLVGRVLKGILSDASLKSDTIHPNARGYEIMAERISKPLTKLIGKADSSRS